MLVSLVRRLGTCRIRASIHLTVPADGDNLGPPWKTGSPLPSANAPQATAKRVCGTPVVGRSASPPTAIVSIALQRSSGVRLADYHYLVHRMMKKRILTMLMGTFLLATQAAAQQVTVTGRVTRDDLPLSGVSVIVKGTTVGTQTNSRGDYTIQVEVGQTLRFRLIGYLPRGTRRRQRANHLRPDGEVGGQPRRGRGDGAGADDHTAQPGHLATDRVGGRRRADGPRELHQRRCRVAWRAWRSPVPPASRAPRRRSPSAASARSAAATSRS